MQSEMKGPGAPTNGGLTSLADLVAANAPQRTSAPTFRDGLSALSYAPPRPRLRQSEESAAGALPLDDEPMPIPSTWREPAYRGDEDRWYRQPMGAALLGLGAGLMIVVPTVLWMSGWLDPRRARPVAVAHVASATASTATVDFKAGEVRTMKVQVLPADKPPEAAAQYVTGSIEQPAASEAPQASEPPASVLAAKFADQPTPESREAVEVRVAAEARARLDDLITQASQRVERGDVAGARQMLAPAEEGSQGPAMFALAETYDPNMLAAWGSRGVSADVARARALYRKALNLGVANARNRLDALR